MSVAARMDNGNLPALPPLDPAELGPSPPPIPTFPMATLKHFPAPERPAAPLDDHPFSPGMLKNPSALRDAIARAKAKVAEREKAKAAESAEPVTVEVHDRENGCEFTLDGEDYDLSELRLTGGQPEYIAVDASKMTYKLNMCAKDPVSGSDCQRSNGMVCQYTSGSNPNLEGVVARWDADPAPVWSFIDESHHEAGVKLSVVNGDDCNFHGMKKTREAVFFFPCNHAVGKLGTITVQETSTCTYVFNIPTSLSCPGEAGMSAGWHFIWTVFLISFCYVVGGCLYNRFRHNAEGIAMFPNLDFWRSLPGLVRDGFAYSRLLLDARMNGGSSSGGDMPDDKADYGAF